MKEGDLITTYYKGYFRLKRIERRFTTQQDINSRLNSGRSLGEEYSPLFHFEQEFDSNGDVKKSKEKACDAQFCQLASEAIKTELEEMLTRRYNLERLLNEHG